MGEEVIEVVDRRRRWSTEPKLKVLMDALEPGASVSAVADRHGVSRSLIYTWLRLARDGRMRGLSVGTKTTSLFAPVQVVPEVPAAASTVACELPPWPRSRWRRASVIEITLSNGRVVKVD